MKTTLHSPVQKPRSGIVCHETNGDIIPDETSRNNVSSHRVLKVVCIATGRANDGEGVSVKMERMLNGC